MSYDVIVVGGSYAGLAAALPLARARRRVLVVDSGQRRNRYSHASHGFLTQDGTPAAQVAEQGRTQLQAYDTVHWIDASALQAEREAGGGFRITLEGAASQTGQLLILATGVIDHLPSLPGLAERWGRQVFHCPYCHGYELGHGRIGVLASNPLAMHQALMLPDWGATTLFLNGAFEPDAEQLAQLAARGVTLERALVARITNHATMVMQDGRIVPLDGLFIAPHTEVASPLAAQLGCEFTPSVMGDYIHTNPMKETRVAGVFACGDAARQPHSVTFAVADGAMAGLAAHRALMLGAR